MGILTLLTGILPAQAASASESMRYMDSPPAQTPPGVTATTTDSSAHENGFRPGQVAEITEGAFMGMTGVVKEINSDTGRVRMEVNVFGRPTSVEVHYSQLK